MALNDGTLKRARRSADRLITESKKQPGSDKLSLLLICLKGWISQMKKPTKYQTRILRNEGDEDYGREFVFPHGTTIDDAIDELMADGFDYYAPRDIWRQVVITIKE